MDPHDKNGAAQPRQPNGGRSGRYKANNAGGYCNPPVKGQFTVGNPGGPGRPKGITNLEAALRKRLGTRLTVMRDGKPTKMTVFEVYAERLLEAILSKSGSPAMLEYGFRLLTRFSSDPTERVPDYSVFNSDELYLFGGLLMRAMGEEPQDDYESPFGAKYNRSVEGVYRVYRRPDRHIVVERVDDAATP